MGISSLWRAVASSIESLWDKLWGILPLFLALSSSYAASAPALNVVVSSETAPPGATVQIKLSLAQSAAVSTGELSLDLPPGIFGPVTAIATFSAAGDACGYATVSGNHLDIHFSSPSATLGSAAGMPLVVITVPTLATATFGAQAAITADPTGSPWTRAVWVPTTLYAVTVTPGKVTLGGTLSVSDVSPVSNLSSGVVVRIHGTGFTSATTVDIAAVAVASVQAPGPQEIDVTLAGAADLGGKSITVRNPDGSQVVFFAAPPVTPLATLGASTPDGVFDGAIPLFPTASYPAGSSNFLEGVTFGRMAITNPNATPVDVLLRGRDAVDLTTQQITLTIPAGGTYDNDFGSLKASGGSVQVLATAPLRMLQLLGHPNYPVQTTNFGFAPFAPTVITPLGISLAYGASVQFNWTTGTVPPQPESVTMYGPSYGTTDVGFTISRSTASGGNWLSVAPTSGTTCYPNFDCSAFPTLTVSATPTGLAPGIYSGTVTITPLPTHFEPAGPPVSFPVTLNIVSAPFVNHIITSTQFDSEGSPSYVLPIPPEILPGPFTIDVVTDSGGNWLSAVPLSGPPPTIRLLAALGNLNPGAYAGVVTIRGSGGNTWVIESSFYVHGGGLQLSIDSHPVFALGPGEPPSAAQTVNVLVQCRYNCPASGIPNDVTWTTAGSTHSGGNWLQAASSFNTTGPGGTVVISVTPNELPPGVYTGVVTFTSDQAAMAQLPVALNVWTGPVPALSATPAAVSISAAPFAKPVVDAADICTSSGNAIVQQTAIAKTSNGGNWLGLTVLTDVTGTCGIQLSVDASHLDIGVYQGDVTIGVQGQTLNVPVTLTIPPPAGTLASNEPLPGSILNAASGVQGAIAPGEIITIHGIDLGSPGANQSGTIFSLDPAGHVPTNLAGTDVLVNGKPVPMLYTSSSQINAIVPYETAGSSVATVQVFYLGQSTVWSVPLAPAAPGIFTLDSTGANQAAVLNQDGSVNGPTQPAARGSVIQIFATGIPVTGAVTGSVTPAPVSNATPSVSVVIGGANATVNYAGPAPDAIAGLIQINALVPDAAPIGPAVPIELNVASIPSQPGVTIAVQ